MASFILYLRSRCDGLWLYSDLHVLAGAYIKTIVAARSMQPCDVFRYFRMTFGLFLSPRHVQIPAGPAAMQLVHVDFFSVPSEAFHVASKGRCDCLTVPCPYLGFIFDPH